MVLLIPLLVLIFLGLASIVWRNGSISMSHLYNKDLVIIHGVIVFFLFSGYYLFIRKVRKAIDKLMYKNEEQLTELDQQKKLLKLEVFQHKKTNAQLYEIRTQDPLTQIYNQVYFQEMLSHEIDRNRRYGSDFSLLIIELDNFIKINDMYGNKFSDYALKKFTSLIENQLRKSDMFARYNGFNLAIIAPNTSINASKEFADRLCRAIELTNISYEGVPLEITLSIGLGAPAVVDELTNENLTQITEHALSIAIAQVGNQAVNG